MRLRTTRPSSSASSSSGRRPLGRNVPTRSSAKTVAPGGRPHLRAGDVAGAVPGRQPQDQVGEGEVGEQLPVAEQQVQPLEVSLGEVGVPLGDVVEAGHVARVRRRRRYPGLGRAPSRARIPTVTHPATRSPGQRTGGRAARGGLRRRSSPRAARRPLLDLASNDYLGLARDPRVVAGAVAAAARLGCGVDRVAAGDRVDRAARRARGGAGRRSSGAAGRAGLLVGLPREPRRRRGAVRPWRAGRVRRAQPRLARRRLPAVAGAGRRSCRTSTSTRSPRRCARDRGAGPGRHRRRCSRSTASSRRSPTLAESARRPAPACVVDEAHALGVVGPGGAGAAAAAGLAGRPGVVLTATLSKSLGCPGRGGARRPRTSSTMSSTLLVRSSSTPGWRQPARAPRCRDLRCSREEPDRPGRARAASRASCASWRGRPASRSASRPQRSSGSAWERPTQAVAAAAALLAAGVRVGCFRPPSVPDGVSRLRLTARADLTDQDLEHVARALAVAVGAARSTEPGGAAQAARSSRS